MNGHAYVLIRTATYNGEQLVKLRNPWGRDIYNGSWNDKDTSKWTADAKAKLGHTTGSDGTFWMPFKDFHTFFDVTTVGMYFDWKRDFKLTGWDRTTAGIAKLSYNVKVDKKQYVVFGV
jgi:hypothetical protein